MMLISHVFLTVQADNFPSQQHEFKNAQRSSMTEQQRTMPATKSAQSPSEDEACKEAKD